MLKIFYRNYFIFTGILIVCALGLGFLLISGEKKVARSDEWVIYTHKIIIEAEQLNGLIEGMLASQRGYLLSGNPGFIEKYELRKSEVSRHLANLTAMVSHNPAQIGRIEEIRQYFVTFSEQLEERASERTPEAIQAILSNVEGIDNLKNNISRINNDFLEDEYALLNARIKIVENRKNQYYLTLLIGGIVSAALMLIFNGYLLRAQAKRAEAEMHVKDREERFKLAVEGVNDGIFDWNIKTDEIFYSRQFFAMLGQDRKAFTGTTDLYWEYIHPEDAERVRSYLREYLRGDIAEYAQTFRMKHASENWIWVHSRAKAIFDKNKQAVRMVGSNTDISSMKEYELKLEEAKRKAEEANQAKSDFLAHMSHEIRTPLTTINGVAEILDNDKKGMTKKRQELIHVLHASAVTLKDLISDILDFSKIESGELQLEEVPFELEESFEHIKNVMNGKAQEKGLEFNLDYTAVKDMIFYGAPLRMRQVLINLIGNAIKFTAVGYVHVRAYESENKGQSVLRIDVKDSGIGIAPEHHELIFERFKQADASVSRRYGGTGLGLPISKKLANLMGGDIFVQSETGKGATFSFILPLRIVENETAKAGKGNQVDKSEIDEKLKDAISELNCKILLVEDYEGNIVVLSHLLQELDCAYDVAKTGLEAVNAWKDQNYHMILMDVQMPEMDGITATAQIRRMEAEKNRPHTPIIGMTAHALVKDKDKCIEAGMDHYLPKPLVEVELKNAMLKYLRQPRKAA